MNSKNKFFVACLLFTLVSCGGGGGGSSSSGATSVGGTTNTTTSSSSLNIGVIDTAFNTTNSGLQSDIVSKFGSRLINIGT